MFTKFRYLNIIIEIHMRNSDLTSRRLPPKVTSNTYNFRNNKLFNRNIYNIKSSEFVNIINSKFHKLYIVS